MELGSRAEPTSPQLCRHRGPERTVQTTLEHRLPDSGLGMASGCTQCFPQPLGLVRGWSPPGRQPGPSQAPSRQQAPAAPGAAGGSTRGCSCWGPVGSLHPYRADSVSSFCPRSIPRALSSAPPCPSHPSKTSARRGPGAGLGAQLHLLIQRVSQASDK